MHDLEARLINLARIDSGAKIELFFLYKRTNNLSSFDRNELYSLYHYFSNINDWKNTRSLIKEILVKIPQSEGDYRFILGGRSYTLQNIITMCIEPTLPLEKDLRVIYEADKMRLFYLHGVRMCPLNYDYEIERAMALSTYETYIELHHRVFKKKNTWISAEYDKIQRIFTTVKRHLTKEIDLSEMMEVNKPLFASIKENKDVYPLTFIALQAISGLENERWFRYIYTEISHNLRVTCGNEILSQNIEKELDNILLGYYLDEDFKYYPGVLNPNSKEGAYGL